MNRAGLRALRVGAFSALVRPKALVCLVILTLAACLLTGFGLTHGSLPIPTSAIGRALFYPETLTSETRYIVMDIRLPRLLMAALCAAWQIPAEIILPTRADEQTRRVMPKFGVHPDALMKPTRPDPQLVLLDLMLPYFNGYHWCSEIRKVSRVPIVFLSSASDNMNIVMAMNMGGDDFIAKPFDLNVLTAKLQAILRRTYDFGSTEQVLECRGAVLNTSNASLTYQGEKLELTKNEYRILQTLYENMGKVVSRDTLMQRLWETDCFVDENTLTVNVTRLRRKLDGIGLQNFIVTRKGMGYLLVEE